MKSVGNISNYRNGIVVAFILLLAICFETVQQIFYIKRFELYEDIQFLSLFKNQFYRWLIWVTIGISLFHFVKKDIEKELTPRFFLKYFVLILGLVVVNIIIISVVEVLLSGEVFSISLLFSEYFLFYFFQKSPIYILGYIAITIILFLNYSKELLQVEVAELIDIKNSNEKLYRELSVSNSDKATILTVKVGNKRKIIPVDTITWLEADDYCVKVHALHTPSYTMRSSLKGLQGKLGNNFLRVHRKGIVNMNMIKEFNLGSTPSLILTNDHKVLISKSNLRAVKDFLES